MAVDAGALRMLQRLERLEQDVARLRTIEIPRGILHREVIGDNTTPSITVSSLPVVTGDLIIKVKGRCQAGATNELVFLRFNGAAGAEYDDQRLQSNAAGEFSQETFARTYMPIGFLPGTTSTTTAVGSMRAWIPEYAEASFYKDVQSDWFLKATVATAGLFRGQWGDGWRSAAAITSVTIGMVTSYFTAGTIITVAHEP
jgi:hypothetical protein